MSDHLLQPTVLVLNKAWQAINTRTPEKVFPQMATNVVTGMNIDGGHMIPTLWADWIKLPIREQDQFVQTPTLKIRIPTVIVCCAFAKVPRRRPKFSSRGVKERDKYTCQYCGHHSNDKTEFNMDHVTPRKLQGKTSWENVVCSCIPCNTKKGHLTLEQVGFKLRTRPVAPPEVSATARIVNRHGVSDWDLFDIPREISEN
jgi:5-methylcytosine-specific restriction endonuclease McrA